VHVGCRDQLDPNSRIHTSRLGIHSECIGEGVKIHSESSERVCVGAATRERVSEQHTSSLLALVLKIIIINNYYYYCECGTQRVGFTMHSENQLRINPACMSSDQYTRKSTQNPLGRHASTWNPLRIHSGDTCNKTLRQNQLPTTQNPSESAYVLENARRTHQPLRISPEHMYTDHTHSESPQNQL
jgi:hypothetical protein